MIKQNTDIWSLIMEFDKNENIVYGRNAVRELLKKDTEVDKIFVIRSERSGSLGYLIALAEEKRIPIVEAEKSKLDKMTGGGVHQGICATIPGTEYVSVDFILERASEKNTAPFIVIADGIEDPHNLGAIIRTCECAGVHGLIIPKRRSASVNSTAVKASAGAASHLPIARVTNIAATVDELKEKGLWIYAADFGGTDYFDCDFSGGVGIVLGSEGDGISRIVKSKCDFTVSIPMLGAVNSLNVSCAAAVILNEVAKQKYIKNK